MKKLLAVAIALVLAMGCMSAFAAEGPIEGLFYPELPDNTLKITANVPNFGTDQRDTKMMKLWQEKMEVGSWISSQSYSVRPQKEVNQRSLSLSSVP